MKAALNPARLRVAPDIGSINSPPILSGMRERLRRFRHWAGRSWLFGNAKRRGLPSSPAYFLNIFLGRDDLREGGIVPIVLLK
jgi:hypothetical protein